MYKILHFNYEESQILFPGKQKRRMNNKDLCHTENSNKTKREDETIEKKREKKYRRKKQLIECYIKDTEMIQLILVVTEFPNVWIVVDWKFRKK